MIATEDKLRTDEMDQFLKAVLTLQNVEECYRFFEDVCTVRELKEMAQRFMVAKMLNEKCVYAHIAQTTGASTATISRVNRSLSYGNDGYRLVLSRIEAESQSHE